MTDPAPAPLVLGLDIGGTSSRARLSQAGRTLVEATAGGANVTTVDPDLVRQRLTMLIEQLGSRHPAVCCAGAAGSEFPAGRRRLEELLASLLPGTRVIVVHDARLILAAAGIDAGIALIAGTGSVAYGRDAQGREARAGGWGWMLGDEGGGVWIVREAMRELMRRRDAGEPAGALGEAMLAATQTDDVLELAGRLQGDHLAADWATHARVVLESTDPAAAQITAQAAAALVALVEKVRAGISLAGPVVMAGGLLHNFAALRERVSERVGAAILLTEEPVAGAVRIAEAL